jgi:Methyltransferase domain
MYERTGRYYAFFGPHAVVTPEEERFFTRWTAGCQRALDLGAGLCGPAIGLARLGLQVLAFEPSPVLAALAMDRLNRGDEVERSITLVEGPVQTLSEPFRADFILMRSVLMLLDDSERAATLDAAARHAAPRARLIVDARTSALPWADQGSLDEARQLGSATFRRHTRYSRANDGTTQVDWFVEAERFGRTSRLAEERFIVRADTAEGLRALVATRDFTVREIYGAYDLDRPHADGAGMIVVVAEWVGTAPRSAGSAS